jgi:hypothetical protein
VASPAVQPDCLALSVDVEAKRHSFMSKPGFAQTGTRWPIA